MTLLALLLSVAIAGPPKTGPLPTEGYVASVYDGDTFTMESGDKIRLRWVNSPELKPHEAFGDEARRFADDFVNRRRVRLAVASSGRDSYGRVIAGVSTDRGDLSLALLEAGLAHVFVIPPDDTNLAPLLAAEARAREARRGIWSTPPYQSALHLTSFHANAPGPDEENVNGEYIRMCNVSGKPVDLSGWAIQNATGQRFPLPQLVVPAGHTVKILAGQGDHQTDPSRQLVAFLGSERPVFSNEGDRAELVDPSGRVVDSRTHEGT